MNFEKNNLKNGDKLKIRNMIYEVLYTQKEVDRLPDEKPSIREYLGIYLHDLNSRSFQPTHMIKYYYDTKEIFFKNSDLKQIKEEEIELI